MSKESIEQKLQTQIDALQKDIKPSRDLWAGIEYAIEHNAQLKTEPDIANTPKDSKQSFTPYAWAASVVAAVLLTWTLNGNVGNGVNEQQIAQISAVEVLQQQYSQERNNMLVSFGEPDLQQLPADIQQQFNELESAQKSLLLALEDDPNNADLLNLLKWTQQQELNLLEQLFSPKWQTI